MTILKQITKYQNLEHLDDAQFKRLSGVRRMTFILMTETLMKAGFAHHAFGDRPNKLCIEDRLVMALKYLVSTVPTSMWLKNYGVSENNAFKTCRWMEDTLIQDKRFALPGKKALLKSVNQYEVVLVDASESPMQRPKKDTGSKAR
jgi:hypothetical protein